MQLTDLDDTSRDNSPSWTPRRGDSVTFKGTTIIPRADWEDRLREVGLYVCGVVKHADVLVDADPWSRTGKAKTAQQLGVPVITEGHLIEIVADLAATDEEHGEGDDGDGDGDDMEQTLPEETVAAGLETALGLLGYLVAVHGDLRSAVEAAVSVSPGTDGIPAVVEELLQDTEGEESAFRLLVDNRYGTVQGVLNQIWEDCDDREEFILRDRLAAVEPSTLEEIARQVGVTRERVRQLQKGLEDWINDEVAAGPVADLLTGVRVRAYPVAPLEHVSRFFPVLNEHLEGWDMPVWQALTGFAAGIDVANGWVSFPDYSTAKQATADLLDDTATPEGTVRISSVLERSGIADADTFGAWIAECGYTVHDGHVLTQTRTHAHYAAGLLSVAGRPMTATELAELMPRVGNEGSFRTALAAAENVTRVGLESWGLRRWGMEEYTDIADLIGRRVDAASDDGESGVRLSELVDELSSTFGVSPKSVMTYAMTGQFISEGGIVSRRDTPQENTAVPEESRGLYLRNGRWCYLMTITKDHLRGSGFVVPNGMTSFLQLRWDEPVTIPGAFGDQKITWGNIGSSSIGSIRQYVEEMDLRIGDRVWVDLHDGEQFSLTPARPSESGVSGMAWLADHVGADPSGDEADIYTTVAEAIGYDANAPRRKILARFRHRLDREAVGVLEGLWM